MYNWYQATIETITISAMMIIYIFMFINNLKNFEGQEEIFKTIEYYI